VSNAQIIQSGDMGDLPDSLPVFLFPDIPFTWETLKILFPVSATLAVVGLLESFADATQFANSFDYLHAPERVVIDLTQAHFWGLSAVGALDRVVLKLRAHGAEVVVVGLNEASDTLIERLGKHRNENAGLTAGH